MWQKRSRSYVLGTMAVAALTWCAAFGCGGGGGPVELPPVSLQELFGSQLYRADGSTVSSQVLNNTPLIGIYFASPGCPACGGFTPVLVDAYDRWREDGRLFEVVLVSLGISDLALFEYMVESSMPWLAVSPQSNNGGALVQRYDIRWVPTLVIIDGAANTISLTGRNDLVQRGTTAYDDWLAASAGS